MLKKLIKTGILLIFFLIALGMSNAYFFTPDLEYQGDVVAYRGGGSLIDYEKLAATNCSAVSLKESGLHSVENTHEAVAASVAAGIDAIHLNVQRTSDDQLVVFHDWTLDCATDGTGPLSQSSWNDLNHIDAGYGYTFDNGKTFPFRGKGLRISKLEEFYSQYPGYKFLVNLKNNDEQSFNVLYKFIIDLPPVSSSATTVITSAKGMDWFRTKATAIKVVSVDSVKGCGMNYLVVGWAGMVPESCRNTSLFIPPSMAKYFWGFPKRLAARLQKYGTDVYLWAEHNPVDPAYTGIVKDGVGVITSDLDFIHKLHADNDAN